MTKPVYKNYDSYKDLGIEAVNRIPTHWLIGRIKEHGTVRARVGWKALTASEYVDEGYVFLSTPNIKNKEIDFDNVNYITKERYVESPEIMLKVGDILLAKDGSTLGTVNIVSYLPRESTVNGSIGVLRFKKQLFNKYVYYQIESEYIQHKIALKKIGMGVPHLFQQDIKNFVILIPPMPEQQAIADYLDTKTAQIDRKIELLEQKAEKYTDLKQSLINKAVTRGLDKTVPMKDSDVEWIGQIPAHWELKRFKDLFTERSQKGYPEEPLLIASQEKGVILKSDYLRNTMTVQQDFHLMKLVKKDDFVISLRSFEGGIEIANNQGIISAAYTILCASNNHSVGYYKHLFKSKKFISMLTTNTTGIREGRNVNYQQLKRELLPFPPPEECQKIAEYLNEKILKINKIVETIYLEVEKLRELRKTLVNDVVTGKIKVYEVGVRRDKSLPHGVKVR